eukprot:11669880-Prorocentrum_lima.AAC.1
MYTLWMSAVNRHPHKDNERDNANTGFVQDDHFSRTTTTGDKGPSNTGGVGSLMEPRAILTV